MRAGRKGRASHIDGSLDVEGEEGGAESMLVDSDEE
jgi:hypothetical protein